MVEAAVGDEASPKLKLAKLNVGGDARAAETAAGGADAPGNAAVSACTQIKYNYNLYNCADTLVVPVIDI